MKLSVLSVVYAGALLSAGVAPPQPTGETVPAPVTVWRVPGEGKGTPAADASMVAFLSSAHEVVTVDPARGTVLWKQPTGGPGQSTMGAMVVLTPSLVIAGDDRVVAFDRSTGAPRWTFDRPDVRAPGLFIGARDGEALLTGSGNGRLVSLDANSGRVRWSIAVSESASTTVFPPIADRGLVIASYTTFTAPPSGGVIAVDASSGVERWRHRFVSAASAPVGAAGVPIVLDDLVMATRGDGTILALARSDGVERWAIPPIVVTSPVPGAGAADFRALTARDGVVIAGSLTGTVVGYDARQRKEVWRYTAEVDGSTAMSIGVYGGTVYVPYFSGRVVALDAASGRLRWRTPDVSAGMIWPPAVVDGTVYFSSASNGFICLRNP